MLTRLFRKDRLAAPAAALQRALVAQARQPALYSVLGVADTLDGRFDATVLHAVLLFRRLQTEGEAGAELSQRTFDLLFRSFDEGLRMIGTGDMTIGKKIGQMAEAFYGRSQAYLAALETGESDALGDALIRNLYRGENPGQAALEACVGYVRAAAALLASQPIGALLQGQVQFPAPPRVLAA